MKLLDLLDSFFTISYFAYICEYLPMSLDFLSLTSNIFIVTWSLGDRLTYVKNSCQFHVGWHRCLCKKCSLTETRYKAD